MELQTTRHTDDNVSFITVMILLWLTPITLLAEEPLSAEELARKTQDPLADVRAIMTDNTIGFGTSDDETSYGFQIQPVYAIPGENANWIARGILPIVGAPAGADLPRLGPDLTADRGTKWGLSDSILQLFWTPKTESDIKWGIGPQVSLRTRTTDRVAGAGWGGGLSGVFFGFAGNFSYGGLLNHHWGQNSYSVSSGQPIIYYNVEAIPGFYLGYNNTITYNWNADSGDRWQVPLGLTVGRTIAIGEAGHALDLGLGAYGLVVTPDEGANWQLKFGISWFFP